MNHYKLSISEINKLFKDKKLKPSELYSEVFERAANTESIIHGHLTLFQDENIKKAADAERQLQKDLGYKVDIKTYDKLFEKPMSKDINARACPFNLSSRLK